MREVERANQRDMETLPQRDLEPAEQRAYPSQSSINYVVRGERVTFIVTSGVLTAGIFGTFVATRDPWILVIGVVWPFLFPFFHAMGLALLERVTPLMIDKMVSDWEAQLREAPRVGDRMLVWYGIRHRKSPVPGRVLGQHNTGTNLPLLLARSRHASVRSLERYARPGPDAVARHLAENDPARCEP